MRGLKCPLPALKTRKLLSGMPAGDILIIECTDPLTAIDIPNLLRQTGDTLEDLDARSGCHDVSDSQAVRIRSPRLISSRPVPRAR